MYSEAEAARLLGVPQSTLHYWLEGRTYRGATYQPILRLASTGTRDVTWAEFIEAGWLKQYRRDLGVPMAELRQFIVILRDRLGVPYPLATKRPWSADKRLVIAAQQEADLPDDLWLYAPVGNQMLLLPAGQAFLDRVSFPDDVAAIWRPHDDRKSPVVIDPDLRFGRPTVDGISTEVLWEYATADYSPAEIAAEFGLSESAVEWALAYEHSARDAA
jgi:uncharacterized protein (DUF433 family)